MLLKAGNKGNLDNDFNKNWKLQLEVYFSSSLLNI